MDAESNEQPACGAAVMRTGISRVSLSRLIVACIFTLTAVALTSGCGNLEAARAYVDEAVPAIVSDWQPSALRARASPALLQQTSSDEIDSLFNQAARQLGYMRRYNGSRGSDIVRFGVGQRENVVGNYDCSADFENGSAVIHVRVSRDGESWRISGFQIAIGEAESD